METTKHHHHHHNDKDLKSSQSAVEDSEEEENEILEESPCGRWHKRREEVEQNNIPGIDATYLAMDTEEGVEVVWNEVRFSERKFFKAKEETISEVFDRLIQLDHPNIVKLHKYWIHRDSNDVPKVVFITEYMSSGSLRQYFEKTKRHDIKISLQVWRRWCTQTLSALCYLHSSQPSIVHGNINCDTIFISYNGLIKIGAIAPDAIHRHVKTVRANAKSNLHFIAPELVNIQDYYHHQILSPSVDIYSFGMCALEMAALEIPSDNDSPHHINEDIINNTIESLDNSLQRDFIQQCLRKDPIKRPTARDLLFHPIIFEVPTLRLFCAHSILNNPSLQPEPLTEEAISRVLCFNEQCDRIVAEIRRVEQPTILFKQSDFPNRELDKQLDEVKNGAYPLTAVMPTTRSPLVCRQRTISPEIIDEAHKLINTPDNPYDEETRRIVYMNCTIQLMASDPTCYDIKIVIKLDDKINRQLTCEILKDQLIPPTISKELVYYGFINKDDKDNVAQILFEALNELNISNNNSNNSNDVNQMAFCEKSLQLQQQNNLQQQQQQNTDIFNHPNITIIQDNNNDNNNKCDNNDTNNRFIVLETRPTTLLTNDPNHPNEMIILQATTTTTTNDDFIQQQQQQNEIILDQSSSPNNHFQHLQQTQLLNDLNIAADDLQSTNQKIPSTVLNHQHLSSSSSSNDPNI